ncbi:MAG: hypothetical protein HC856_11470, partial [Pseudanabaena sp. RU_4_16]|nr:hypothetical protein [Pseudanabaena sp. RU_4_16]
FTPIFADHATRGDRENDGPANPTCVSLGKNEASHLIPNPTSTHSTANHTAISVPASTAQIQAIADRESWRMVQCRRGDDYFIGDEQMPQANTQASQIA